MLPTDKLYKTMSLKEYNQAKLSYVAALAPDYRNKSIPERWNIVMERMKRLAPHKREQLEFFRQSRINTNASLFNLSLADCVDYFENFAFLYQTEDERFNLTKHQKSKLLEAIDDAMGTCETGINTRFELVLQQFRTDLNWITNILSKYRYQLIIKLQDDYNTQFQIDDIYRTHTLKRMMHLASKPYGISIEHTMLDVFAHTIDRSGVMDYFATNAPRMFKTDYEDQIVEVLAQDLLLKIKALYCPNDFDWASNELVINQADVNEFRNFVVGNRLDLPPNTIYQLGTLDEEEEDESGHERQPTFNFYVKKQAELLDTLRDLIKQKLFKERYFIAFDDLTRDNLSSLQRLGVRGVNLNELVELKEAFDIAVLNPAKLRMLLQQHSRIILQYPELLVRMIELYPTMVKYIPRVLTNNLSFNQKIINPIMDLMSRYQVEDDKVYGEISQFVATLHKHPDLKVKYPKHLFNDNRFALHLMQHNGLLLSNLPASLKLQDEIIQTAVQQNPFALLMLPENEQTFYEGLALQHPLLKSLNWTQNFREAVEYIYREQYFTMSQAFPNVFPNPDNIFPELYEQPQHLYSTMEKMAAFTQLTASSVDLSLAKMTTMMNFISPNELASIIEFRELYNVHPLPYCNSNMLEHFSSSIKSTGLNWNPDNTTLLRMEASQCLLVNPNQDIYEDNVIGCLAKTDNWFLAMVHYENSTTGAFKTKRQAGLQFKKWLDQLGNILFSLTKLALGTVFLFELYIFLDLLATSLLLSTAGILLSGIFAFGLLVPFVLSQISENSFLYNSLFAFGALSYFMLLPLPSVLGVFTFFSILELVNLAEASAAIFLTTFSLLGRSLQTLFSRHDYVMHQTSDLHIKCENSITRLELMESSSAQEKAELMQDVLTQIDKEYSAIPTKSEAQKNRAFGSYLFKPYHVESYGISHFFSFQQAAALPRSNSQPLDVDAKNTHHFRFFRTTTSNGLPDQADIPSPRNVQV